MRVGCELISRALACRTTSAIPVKGSVSLVNGSFGAIGDNGDNLSGANGCSIGANGDRHWRPLAPFEWRHLIHSMAILRSQSPFRVSGSFGDPMAPIDPVASLTSMTSMAIHLRQWHQ